MRRALRIFTVSVTALILAGTAVAADTVSVHVQRKVTAGHNVHVTFHARRLPDGGYYYAVSSKMQRTDYGYVEHGKVALGLTPAYSRTGHWCPGGRYVGAIYAVPHSPPCESTYPCRSEPYKQPCAGIGPGCITGVVAN